ncbi:MAG: STAS-like domain-containing protein [Bacteroidetes bacterium]|nr:STAS-like domain-containing protein [Bacteroidota bacterium]
MNTVKIIVNQVTTGTLSNADGYSLKAKIIDVLANGDAVLLSFDSIITISSSFLNSSIGEIVDQYGFDILKDRVKITHYTPSIASAIKNYISNFRILSH